MDPRHPKSFTCELACLLESSALPTRCFQRYSLSSGFVLFDQTGSQDLKRQANCKCHHLSLSSVHMDFRGPSTLQKCALIQIVLDILSISRSAGMVILKFAVMFLEVCIGAVGFGRYCWCLTWIHGSRKTSKIEDRDTI